MQILEYAMLKNFSLNFIRKKHTENKLRNVQTRIANEGKAAILN